MILDQFQVWARTAPASGRADGVRTLARAYLYSDLGSMRREALRVLTEFLDDPSPIVRRALAEALANAERAPHHIILALADDQADIAAVVLARSPLLRDAELVDCATSADVAAQVAIASRPMVSETVAAALAEVAAPSALAALARNRGALVPSFAFRRMIARHGQHAELREALLMRPDLPPCVRVDLVGETTRALATFVTQRSWLSEDRMRRVATESRDKAAIIISGVRHESQLELVTHLRTSGQLTTNVALRAVLSGRLELFKAIVSELSGVALTRVDALTRQFDSAGFAAVYRKAGLPASLLLVFRAALRAVAESDVASSDTVSLVVVERVLSACEAVGGDHLDGLLAMLRRFETEAARDEARVAGAPSYRRALAAGFAEPLVLRDMDAPEWRAGARPAMARQPARRTRVPYVVDLAAIESELLAA